MVKNINYVSQLKLAIEAAQKFIGKKSDKSSKLFEKEELYRIIFTFSKVLPGDSIKKLRIKLIHPIFDKNEVCIIVHDNAVEAVEKELKASGVEGSVISYKQYTTDYPTFESRRQLVGSYDTFLVDRALYDKLNTITMSVAEFHKSRKLPIPIRITKEKTGKTANAIKSALNCTYTFMKGNCSQIPFAKTTFSTEQILSNADNVIKKIVECLPGNAMIESIGLKFSATSPELPFYNDIDYQPTINLKRKREEKKEKVKDVEEVEEEEVQEEEENNEDDEDREVVSPVPAKTRKQVPLPPSKKQKTVKTKKQVQQKPKIK